MYYYLFKKLYHTFFVKEEKEDSHRHIRRMAITRKAFEDFEENDKKEIRNDFKKLFK